MSFTEEQWQDAFLINEKLERAFSNYLTLEGYTNHISIEQGDNNPPSLLFQNVITGPAPFAIYVDGQEENLGFACEIYFTARIDRQDQEDADYPDLRKINLVIAQLMTKLMRGRVKAGLCPHLSNQYFLPVESFTFKGLDHAIDEDRGHDLITLVYSYNLYVVGSLAS